METLTVAVAQAPVEAANVAANAATAIRLLEEAAARGARLAVFPELFLGGYDLPGMEADPRPYGVAPDGAVVSELGAACRRLNITAVIGASVPHGGGWANGAIVLDRHGRHVATYNKIQLWATERAVFTPGDRYVMFGLDGFRIGVLICYDAGFPEHSRALARAGADLIVCPSAFARGDEERRYDLYFPQRALENTVYVAVANAVGEQGGLSMFGRSCVFGPRGTLLCAAGSGRDVAVAQLDKQTLMSARRDLPYLSELRTDIPRPTLEGGD